MLALRLPAHIWQHSIAGQAETAAVLALQKRSIPGFATAKCGFQPHFERVTVKVGFG
jgi:hypothetical protein